METNVLRLILLVVLFFVLTCEYSSILDSVFGDQGEETNNSKSKNKEYIKDENTQPKSINTKNSDNSRSGDNGVASGEKSYNHELALNDVINGDEDYEDDSDIETDYKGNKNSQSSFQSVKKKMMNLMKNSCLPKLICELNASTNKDAFSEGEKSLLRLIRDTSISMTAEVTSKYHFAAHMGQLISGIDGNGCHNFYPSCPLPGVQILNMLKTKEN